MLSVSPPSFPPSALLPRPEARDERIRLWPHSTSVAHHHGQPGMLCYVRYVMCADHHRRLMDRPRKSPDKIGAHIRQGEVKPRREKSFRCIPNCAVILLTLPSLRLNLRVASEVRWMNGDLTPTLSLPPASTSKRE